MSRTHVDDPLQGFKFRVSIPGLPNSVGFVKVSGLSKEIGVVTYDEGGYNNTHKMKGKTETGELVCEKGMFANKQVEEVFKASMTNPDFRGVVTVDVMNPDNTIARTWTCTEAWCNKWEIGDIDASSEDPIVETITIQYEDII